MDVIEFNKKINNNDRLNMLDAGCGVGRLMLKYCEYFDTCTCIDADNNRLYMAKQHLFSNNDFNNKFININNKYLFFENVGMENFNHRIIKYYDLIINSHVIQHISIALANKGIKHLIDKLQPNGILIIATTHFPVNKEAFSKFCCDAKNIKCNFGTSYITSKEFESLCEKNDINYIPVHYWTMESLRNLVINNGCKNILNHFTYTYHSKVNNTEFADIYGPLTKTEYYDNPVSQAIICKKT